MDSNMTTTTTERATHVREIHTGNITQTDRRNECYAEEIDCLADVAMALDGASDSDAENRGNSGYGAGASLEALIVTAGEDADEADGETVESVDDPLFTGLPFGEPERLRRFITAQKRSTVWNGNNHVDACYHHSEQLLARIRCRA